jgi:ribosomal protein L13
MIGEYIIMNNNTNGQLTGNRENNHNKYRETGESMSISELNFIYIKEALRALKKRLFSIKMCKCGKKRK